MALQSDIRNLCDVHAKSARLGKRTKRQAAADFRKAARERCRQEADRATEVFKEFWLGLPPK